MTALTEEQVEEEMRAEGFLSPKLEEFRGAVITSHTGWFALARRFNTLAMKVWLDHPITQDGLAVNSSEPLIIRLFARAISGYQGALMLLERGMTVEAGTLIRSLYETGFWIGYLHDVPTAAVKHFQMDELKSKEGRLRSFEKLYASDPKKLADIRASLVQTRSKLRDQPLPPGIENIAIKGGAGKHYANYKILCGGSAHASLSSTNHYLEFNEDQTVGHVIGPDIEGTGRMVAFAIHAMFVAFAAFIQSMEDSVEASREGYAIFLEYSQRAQNLPPMKI